MNTFEKRVGNPPLPPDVYLPVASGLMEQYNANRPGGPKKLLCYAPFKSIYFGHAGRVVACCYNRQCLLGVFPQKSIREIWFGEEMERLRQHILHDDLSLGCHLCKNHFTANNFDAVQARMYDRQRRNDNGFPSVMEFELINTCNLECVQCDGEFSSSIRKNREKKEPIKEVYDAEFLRQTEEFIPWLEEAKFYGGEPFLINIYYELWDRIARMNPECKIAVQTNATILNNRVNDLLSQCKFNISISIDSLEKEVYEKIRIHASFETVMKNIHYFRNYAQEKNTFFGISVCPMRQNWQELPSFVHFCNQLNVPVYFHTVRFPSSCTLSSMDSVSLGKICDTLENVQLPIDSEIKAKNSSHYYDTVNQFKSWYEKAKSRESRTEKNNSGKSPVDFRKHLFDRVRDYIFNATSLSHSEKESKMRFFIDKMNDVLERIPDKSERDRVLKNSENMDIEVIISTLALNSEENLVNKALASGNRI